MNPVDLSRPAHTVAPRSGDFPVRRLGERLAVVCAGARLDERTARAYTHAVLRIAREGVRELVLDLSSVRYHAWPAVYALCELEAHLIESCCDPVAVAADDSLVRDLEAVGLERAWSMCPNIDVALTQLLARPVSAVR